MRLSFQEAHIRLEVKDQLGYRQPFIMHLGLWVPMMEVCFYLKRAHTRPKI